MVCHPCAGTTPTWADEHPLAERPIRNWPEPRHIIVARNMQQAHYYMQDLSRLYRFNPRKAIVVLTESAFGSEKLRGIRLTESDRIHKVGEWFKGRYTSEALDILRLCGLKSGLGTTLDAG